MQTSQHATLAQTPQTQERKPGCIHACTDITGFGLLGHLEMVAASDRVVIELSVDHIPVLPGAMEMLHAGIASTPHLPIAWLDSLRIQVHATNSLGIRSNNIDPAFETLLIDPQTWTTVDQRDQKRSQKHC